MKNQKLISFSIQLQWKVKQVSQKRESLLLNWYWSVYNKDFKNLFDIIVSGNCLVLFVLCLSKLKKSPTIAYMLNLSIADLLVCVFVIPPTAFALCFFDTHWMLGRVYCKVCCFFFQKFCQVPKWDHVHNIFKINLVQIARKMRRPEIQPSPIEPDQNITTLDQTWWKLEKLNEISASNSFLKKKRFCFLTHSKTFSKKKMAQRKVKIS